MIDGAITKSEYARWLASGTVDGPLREELLAIANDEPAITDRFWRQLFFGTGGLRGIMGAGTNRINDLTVRRATQGLADHIKENGGAAACIAYDTRNMSQGFAIAAAETLCANEIQTYMFTGARPTPMLSFAVREKRSFAGIVITASHNPREHNGYKVYGADGGQITDKAVREISSCINSYDILSNMPRLPISTACKRELLFDLDSVDTLYYNRVKSLIVNKELVEENAGKLSILYTPLHGTGNLPVRRVLAELGFTDLSVVAEQELPDGNFPTIPRPNPEEPSAFALALERAEGQDIILATDPDCDRIGVLALTSGGKYAALSGNQIGALLCEYIIAAKKEIGTLGNNPAVIKTIVTTELARKICNQNGVKLVDVLTGFKYIGEKIGEWERSGKRSFLFGFEESCGYLAGDFVRDKDAVIAAALVCEMALHYKLKGLTLHDALERLFAKYGHWDERLISVAIDGADGMEKMGEIMKMYRTNHSMMLGRKKAAVVEDYLCGIRGLPKSDVIRFMFGDSSWLAVRPSGTEPKVKFYFGAAGNSQPQVESILGEIENIVKKANEGHNSSAMTS